MSVLSSYAKWCIPQGFLALRRKAPKDVNETVTPIQLRHIRRYEFARTQLYGQVVLDAACGSGYGSDLLEPISEYVGIDYADYCVNFAKKNYSATNRRFVEENIYRLNELFPPNSFDTIISFETIEHIDNPEKVVKDFLYLIKPKGTLIISIPLNHPDLFYHKKQYTHGDVLDLFNSIYGIHKSRIHLTEYLQKHLLITPLQARLSKDATGTWIGVFRKQCSE